MSDVFQTLLDCCILRCCLTLHLVSSAAQSERFFAALKGHGAPARLVMLPHESHGYAAYESVLHVLWEMDTWLATHFAASAAAAAGGATAAPLPATVQSRL